MHKGLSKRAAIQRNTQQQRIQRGVHALINDQQEHFLELAQLGKLSEFQATLLKRKSLKEKEKLCNYQDSKGRTALHFAASKNHTRIVELLLQNKAQIDTQDCRGNSALHLAALSNHWVTVLLLLKYGANPIIQD
jgi:ankyrin repeat protein